VSIGLVWSSAAVGGAPGFRFLNMGAASRAAAMGDAHVAVGGDVAAMYWNPALLADVRRSQASVTHLEWFQSFRLESAALGVVTPQIALGAQVTGLYADQDDLVATDDTGAEQGHFGFYDLSATVGAARRMGESVALGLAGKVIVESINSESYGSVAADAGVTWTTPARGLRLAGAISNLGPMSQVSGVDIDLPLTARVGGAYQRVLTPADASVTLAADFVTRRDDGSHPHVGAEVVFRQVLRLSAGWRGGYDSQAGSLGGGVRAGRSQVDYAFAPSSTGLGSTHRFTLQFDL
jgi:hypothetical protein